MLSYNVMLKISFINMRDNLFSPFVWIFFFFFVMNPYHFLSFRFLKVFVSSSAKLSLIKCCNGISSYFSESFLSKIQTPIHLHSPHFFFFTSFFFSHCVEHMFSEVQLSLNSFIFFIFTDIEAHVCVRVTVFENALT